MKKLLTWLLFCLTVTSASAQATNFTDLQFGRYQVADSQWNVSACMYSASWGEKNLFVIAEKNNKDLFLQDCLHRIHRK